LVIRGAWRRCAFVLIFAALAGCRAPPSELVPLGRSSEIQAAEPRINTALPIDRPKQPAFEARGTPNVPELKLPPGAAPGTGDVTLNFVDTDIREIARTILGATLKLNYSIDPSVKGTASIETGKPLPRAALLPTLETLLNENGATLVEKAGIYNVVPIAGAAVTNAVAAGAAGAATGTGTQVIPLRFAAPKALVQVLQPYVGEGGKIAAETGHNALIISGDARVRQTLAALVSAFDIDLLAGRSYALFPAGDADPAKLASELEKVLGAESEGPLSGVVRVLPMSRVNAVLVISSQPRYLDAALRFFKLADRAEDATARTWHVYYVKNGQSADLELLLQRAFTPGRVSPTPVSPGTTAPGQQRATLTSGGGANQPGGTPGAAAGGPGAAAPPAGTGTAGTPAGVPAGYAGAAAPTRTAGAETSATEPLSPETGAAGKEEENRVRIIANQRNNALLIYATPAEYSVIEGMLRKIDIVPLQVMIEATIAEVTLNDALQYGTQFFFKLDHFANSLGTSIPNFPSLSSAATPLGFSGFVLSSPPHVALSALADVSQVKVLSAPQVVVLDNEPAQLQVGQQVPVLTGTATSTLTTGAPVVSSVSYQDTGVILKVTPRVNSGGLVTLEIGQEVSDVTTAAVNTVQGSPTFDDRVIQTKVAVQDGQTVGLAGLISDSDTQDNAGLPFLKDIPVISTLVSSQNNSRARKELLVLITPHVIRDQAGARALTEDLRNQLINAGLIPQQLERRPPSGSPNPNGL